MMRSAKGPTVSLRARIEEFLANRADLAELHELLLECMNNGTVEGLAAILQALSPPSLVFRS